MTIENKSCSKRSLSELHLFGLSTLVKVGATPPKHWGLPKLQTIRRLVFFWGLSLDKPALHVLCSAASIMSQT
jgi:hypothetical protein